MTGFEFHLNRSQLKKINHMRIQISKNRGKISAKLQLKCNPESPDGETWGAGGKSVAKGCEQVARSSIQAKNLIASRCLIMRLQEARNFLGDSKEFRWGI